MSWQTAVSELRNLLDDGPKDKLRFRKKVLGAQDGSNVSFKTLEFRRITDFTGADLPLGVFINGEPTTVTEDFPEIGAFTLDSAPATDDLVEASYYAQYFLDEQLEVFIKEASKWILSTENYVQTDPGLQPCVLKYASGDAYQKLAVRFIEHMSGTYRMEDIPDPNQRSFVKDLQDMALAYKTEATKMRDEFYTRQGQSLQPLWANNMGRVREVTPNK